MTNAAYRTQSPDTSAKAERALFDLYRRMTSQEKFRAIFELQRAGDEIALAGIRSRHPGIDEREARLRLAALKYPRALMIAAFGWDPDVRGF